MQLDAVAIEVEELEESGEMEVELEEMEADEVVEEQGCRWEAGKHKPSPRSKGCQWHFSPGKRM